MKIIPIPSEISIIALLTIIPCVAIGMYMSFIAGHINLCLVYGLLLMTSVLYWTNTEWENIMYVDMLVAFTILSFKSYVIITNFTSIFKYIWVIALCIMGISFMINREILMRKVYRLDEIENTTIGDLLDRYYPIKYTDKYSDERNGAYKMSVTTHILSIHLLATIVFVSGLYQCA